MQVKEEDRPKTAFSTHRGQFQWRVTPFDGIKTDPDKVQTVRTWPTPVHIKELQSFIGLAVTIGGLFLDSRSSQNHSTNCRGRVFLSSGRWNKKVPSMNWNIAWPLHPSWHIPILVVMQDYSYLTQMPANPWALAFFYLDCSAMTLTLKTGRKPFPGAITLETTQLYGKQTKISFCAIKLSETCFSQEKAKTLFFAIESSKKLNFVAN